MITPRLLLRAPVTADLDAIHAILSDPSAMEYWSRLPHDTTEESRAWLQSMIDLEPNEGEEFVVQYAGRVIGKVGFYRFPEIGFIFRPDVWGLGLASEAVSAVIARGFAVHRLASIKADVDPNNLRCLRLLKRLGFGETGRAERTWKLGDRWCDSAYLDLPRPILE